MQGQMQEQTLGSCGREQQGGGLGGGANICRSSAQPWPSGSPFASSSTLLYGSETIPAMSTKMKIHTCPRKWDR